MEENPKLGNSDALSLSCELGEMDTQKISVSDQTNSLQFTNTKPDSFTVDIDRLSHLTDKDKTANSRITLQRSFSRKGSQLRGNEKKINPSTPANDQDPNIVSTTSPRAALAGSSTPEKPMVVTVGTTNHPMNSPQLHHQITITTGNIGGADGSTPKRSGFRRSPPSWTVNPRRVVFFFATLSSMGTLLLIYFTLSMGKLRGDDNAVDW